MKERDREREVERERKRKILYTGNTKATKHTKTHRQKPLKCCGSCGQQLLYKLV